MRRVLEALLVLLGVAVAALLLLPHLRSRPAGSLPAPHRGSAVFHAGKAPVAPPSNGCGGEGCHDGAPHRAGGSLAAFRNLHGGKAECLACHGAAGRSAWAAGRGGHVLSSTLPDAAAPDPHRGTTRRAPACRECHSREGEGALRRAGASSLVPTFADPMALRMLEGGGRRW